ncbi:hypothetical protein PSACC_03697 [Paramicrosporidium saccamoebae]|uniref:Chromatin modification-related protein EAF6 n=1 Tax=Paramicrosporidium saccamoebae TaxID=1246581 RepID=A0A2H9TFZ7_9FUNG|nr:hypothetical protein PSACC_03697 [Paramicrosporidium saccamoebae]
MEQAGSDIPPTVKVAEAPLVTVPTTEELVDLEKEIQRLIDRKRRTDLHIIDLEARIHAVETEYFRETSLFGSLLNGLEGYLGASSALSRRQGSREVRDGDRLFSHTSSSHPRALAVHSRLTRERVLNPISIGSTKKSPNLSSVVSSSRKKRPSSDPAWTTPAQKVRNR